MRVSEAAKKLGVSPATVRNHIKDGALTATKVADEKAWPDGWRWEVNAASVEANQGRWKGRGKYRDCWLADSSEVDVLVVEKPEPRIGSRPRRDAAMGSSSKQQRPSRNLMLDWDRSLGDKLAVLAIGCLILLGSARQLLEERSKQGRGKRPLTSRHEADTLAHQHLVFDPTTLRWRCRSAGS